MESLIASEPKMKSNYKLTKSVKGVGRILAIQMLLHTHNYSRFEEWRQFSAYCGLVLSLSIRNKYTWQKAHSCNQRY
ncbi:MAG: transposase [Bacteroidetes bacterium]|nr:transposase [Bacteroidota bacterium]